MNSLFKKFKIFISKIMGLCPTQTLCAFVIKDRFLSENRSTDPRVAFRYYRKRGERMLLQLLCNGSRVSFFGSSPLSFQCQNWPHCVAKEEKSEYPRDERENYSRVDHNSPLQGMFSRSEKCFAKCLSFVRFSAQWSAGMLKSSSRMRETAATPHKSSQEVDIINVHIP